MLQLERGKLYCAKADERVNELSLGVKEYMKYLVPTEETMDTAVLSPSSNVISLSSLRLLPVVDQVRSLLKDGTFEMREGWLDSCIWA